MHTAWTLVHGKMMHGGEPWPKTGPAIFSFAHGPKPIEIRFVPSPPVLQVSIDVRPKAPDTS